MQATANTEMKRNIADMDSDMARYANLLANILKVQQQQRSMTPNDQSVKPQPSRVIKATVAPKKPMKAAEKPVSASLERKKKSVLKPQTKPMSAKTAKPVQATKSTIAKPTVVSEKASKPAESQVENKHKEAVEPPRQSTHESGSESELNESEENVLKLVLFLAKNFKEDKGFLSSFVTKLNEITSSNEVKNSTESEPHSVVKPPTQVSAETPKTPSNENNYSDRISQLEKQVLELSITNKNLLKENQQSSNQTPNSSSEYAQQTSHTKPFQLQTASMENNSADKTSIQMQNQLMTERLKNELMSSNQKCKMLEQMLEQKCRQVDKYSQIFKETNDQLRFLLSEIEEKKDSQIFQNQYAFGTSNCPNGSASNDSFIDSMRKNLISLQSKLLHYDGSARNKFVNNHVTFEPNLQKISAETYKPHLPSKPMFERGNFKSDNFSMFNLGKCDQEGSAATSSDTLVDADSSFDSLNLDLILKKNQLGKRHSAGSSKLLSLEPFENASLPEDDEAEDESERIEIDLDELSFNTMQTATSTATTVKTVDSVSTLKSQDDIVFQDGLKKLDEKIHKVKQLLDSIRPA